MSDSYICQLHGNANKKPPENEGTLFTEYWREKLRKRNEQDWSKMCWNEVENE